jgi:Holliday junction DNA helicase RuvB
MSDETTSNRYIAPQKKSEDLDNVLRPQKLEHFTGQEKLKANLAILIEAAKQRKEPLDHILFHGPPGLGKTTLSHIIANEMGVNIRITAGPAIERAGDLAAILTNLRAGDILFIDEVHRLGRAVEEILYPAMEDFVLDIIVGKGPGAKNVRLKLPKFTVIGATTRLAMLTAPLRARFGALYRMDFYELEAIQQIVQRGGTIFGMPVQEDGALEIARRARGTPRVALRILRRVRDYAQVRGDGVINQEAVRGALELLEIDHLGLDDLDRRVLLAIIEKFGGGPVGLDTISASISEESDTIMDVVEPYLLQLGFVARTARGRVATKHAYLHLGIPLLNSNEEPPAQPSLL